MDEHKYEESPETRAKKSQIAEERPRDSEGHFIHQDPPSPESQTPLHKIEHLLAQDVHYSKKQDDLLDLHVGNPLRKITQLLEDIKKQKAFSFSIKGSLGIMGVVLVAGTFGVLGVNNVLCDKGMQTDKGTLEVLNIKENSDPSFLDYIPVLSSFITHPQSSRIILTDIDNKVIHVVTRNGVNLSMFLGVPVTISGNYDSCSQKMTVPDASGVQLSSVTP